MNAFEYLAYDSQNNFAVIRKSFETFADAEKYKNENMATHSNATLKNTLSNIARHTSEDLTELERKIDIRNEQKDKA